VQVGPCYAYTLSEAEEYSLSQRIRRTITANIGRHYYPVADFDAALAHYLPDVQPHSKEYQRLLKDAMYCCYCYGAVPDDYFVEHYWEKNHFGRNRYISTGKRYRVYRAFNGKIIIPEIDAKTECAETFRDLFQRDFVRIAPENDAGAFADFFNRHDEGIIKPNRGYGGHGFQILQKSALGDYSQAYRNLVEQYGEAILEERIIQDHRMHTSMKAPSTRYA